MASQKLTQYELKRLENIKRNAETMAALNIHSKAAALAGTKRQRRKASTVRKPTTENLAITRESLRPRGMPPDSADDLIKPIRMIDAYTGTETEYNQILVETILSIAKETQTKDDKFSDFSEKGTMGSCKSRGLESPVKQEIEENLGVVKNEHLESLDMKPETVAWVAPGTINVVKFFPCSGTRMIAAGNNLGDISFWNVDCEDETEDGAYVYRPHTGQISDILIQQHSMSKIYSCGYDGFILLMDAEKEVFDLVHSCDDAIYSLSQQPDSPASLYFGRRHGAMNVWDIRTGKSSKNWMLHDKKINTISFNPKDPHIMATSSADGTARIWDLRTMSSQKPKTLKTVRHTRAVHSAYFSPSGRSLATTCLDDNVFIINGVNFEDISTICLDNPTRKISYSSSRGIWGWDDSYIFIANMKKGVRVISATQKRTIRTLQSPQGSSIPYRFDTHPYEVGLLAGATLRSHVCLWTPS
ncbi:hypothetical protein V6N11_007694 [Hibiscus sabdariffa]|uniref:WD repeat-containing protein 76 n=1 Tax=Hibiscus sabdariffa TaxID=183260 RepID=A0ABR2NJF5_9ROSI